MAMNHHLDLLGLLEEVYIVFVEHVIFGGLK